MNHIYFTALINGAGLAAALATGDGQKGLHLSNLSENSKTIRNVTDKNFLVTLPALPHH